MIIRGKMPKVPLNITVDKEVLEKFKNLCEDNDIKISTKIKSSRSKELSQITKTISGENLKKWRGWEGIVLIDEKGKKPNQVIGRNTSYLPVVLNDGTIMQGQVVETRIIDNGATYLIGELV